MVDAIQNTGLNEVQLTLLKLFNRKMTIEESIELRDILFNHYSKKLGEEVDKVVAEKGIQDSDYDKLRNKKLKSFKI